MSLLHPKLMSRQSLRGTTPMSHTHFGPSLRFGFA
jgi:hypothetical protein